MKPPRPSRLPPAETRNFPFRHEAPPIPDHEVLRCIGKGSYGEVWMARGLTGSLRAVKVVHRKDFELERTFEREFEGLKAYEPIARESPYIVDILHVGRNKEHNFYYYVMELADDERTGTEIVPAEYVPLTLASEVQRRGRVPLGDCLEWGMDLCRGLGYLHKCGLAHRDIKPSNVIFVKGHAMLADMGLVAASGGEQSYVGTDGFVPPEGPGSERADIFSLGMVLYEISTGLDRFEFPALPEDFANAKVRDQLLALNEVFCRACAPLPKRRFQSAVAMGEELRSISTGEYLPSKVPSALAAPALGVGAAALVVGFSAGGSGLVITGPPPELPAEVANAAPPRRLRQAEIVIESDPPGAEIWLRGERVGETPKPLSLQGGNYVFTLRKARYRDRDVPVSALSGEEQRVGPLALEFYSPPVPGQPWVNHIGMRFLPEEDGTWRAEEPATYQQFIRRRGELLEGEVIPWKLRSGKQGYIVYVPKADIQAFCEWLTERDSEGGFLPPDYRYRYEIETENVLDRVEEVRGSFHAFRPVLYEQEFGELTLTSEPPGAAVYDEGVLVGETPLREFRIESGTRTLELRLDGYQTGNYPLALQPGVGVEGSVVLRESGAVVFGGRWENSLGMRFVPVGDPAVEGLLVGAHEVRERDYRFFRKEAGLPPGRKPAFNPGANHPATFLGRADAEAFCRWLTGYERATGMIGEGDTYRLPTDQEWSLAAGSAVERGDSPAARSGRTFGVYPWGIQWPPPPSAGNFADQTYRRSLAKREDEVIQGYRDNRVHTAPVARFTPNAYGVYDVAGNVWEWVSDPYGGDDEETSGKGVVRGGSWRDSKKDDLGLGYRRPFPAEVTADNVGFRVVLSREEPEGGGDEGGGE